MRRLLIVTALSGALLLGACSSDSPGSTPGGTAADGVVPAPAAGGTSPAAGTVAATAGACLIFLVARTSLGDLLQRRAGGRLARLGDGFRENAFSYLLFLRLAPEPGPVRSGARTLLDRFAAAWAA